MSISRTQFQVCHDIMGRGYYSGGGGYKWPMSSLSWLNFTFCKHKQKQNISMCVYVYCNHGYESWDLGYKNVRHYARNWQLKNLSETAEEMLFCGFVKLQKEMERKRCKSSSFSCCNFSMIFCTCELMHLGCILVWMCESES